jgi:polysaccharide biosynthesis protein PslH
MLVQTMPEDKKSVRVFLITAEFKANGGREQLSASLMDGLRLVTDDQLEVYRLSRPSKPISAVERIIGRIDGITSTVEKNLVHRLSDVSPDCVFIDGSNLGRLARIIRNANVKVPIVTFYHNVETRFFFDALCAAPSLRALGVLLSNTIAERCATYHSDIRVMLNDRDSLQLGKVHGRQGTDLLPMMVPDFYYKGAAKMGRPLIEKYALFVGGSFYANVEGLAWYAENIASRSPIPTMVIGRGMEAHRIRLEQWGGLCVIGEVEDLAPWYAHAQIVVAPILSGSGMKTKTAEALMHGKPILGTPEAFVGFRIGWTTKLKVCEEPGQFLDALQNAAKEEAGYDHSLRAHYEKYHSDKMLRSRLTQLLKSILQNNEYHNSPLVKEI